MRKSQCEMQFTGFQLSNTHHTESSGKGSGKVCGCIYASGFLMFTSGFTKCFQAFTKNAKKVTNVAFSLN